MGSSCMGKGRFAGKGPVNERAAAAEAVKRMSSGRHQRRAQEAIAKKRAVKQDTKEQERED